MSPAWSAATIAAAVVVPILAYVVITNRADIAYWWTGWQYRGARRKPRRPGAALVVPAASWRLDDKFPPADLPRPDSSAWLTGQGDPEARPSGPGQPYNPFWDDSEPDDYPTVITTVEVQGVHLPLDASVPQPDVLATPRDVQTGLWDPPWQPPIWYPDDPTGKIRCYRTGFNGRPSRNHNRDLDDTFIDSPPRTVAQREITTRPYGDTLTDWLLTASPALVASGRWP